MTKSAKIIALKAELQVRTSDYGSIVRPERCYKQGARSAYDAGYHKGWLNRAYSNPYTAEYCRRAYILGYSEAQQHSADEIARVIQTLTP